MNRPRNVDGLNRLRTWIYQIALQCLIALALALLVGDLRAQETDYDLLILDHPDLLAYWRFNEPEGETTADEERGFYDGTYHGNYALGAPGAIVGDSNTAADFMGDAGGNGGGWVELDLATEEDFTATPDRNSPFTIEAWVQPDTLAAGGRSSWIASKDEANPNVEYQLGTTAGGFRATMQSASGISTHLADPPFPITLEDYGGSRWFHVAAVREPRVPGKTFTPTFYLYVNGELAASISTSGFRNDSVNSLLIGARSGADRTGDDPPGPNEFFNGRIDELAIYNAVLSQEELRARVTAAGRDCPENDADGDTHIVGDLEVSSDTPGVYTVTANTVDDSGEQVWHIFSAEGPGAPQVKEPQSSNSAEFTLSPGFWTLSLRVDDTLVCDDQASDATADIQVVVPPSDPGVYADLVRNEMGLLAHWRLGESSAAEIAEDATGTFDGVYSSAPAPRAFSQRGAVFRDINRAIDFGGGTMQLADPGDNVEFHSGGTAWTVEAWCKLNNVDHAQWMVAKDDRRNGQGSLDYLLGADADGHFVFRTQGEAHIARAPIAAVIDGETWHHVVGVQDPDAGKVSLFVDGLEVVSVDLTTTGITVEDGPLTLGSPSLIKPEQFVDGLLDEVAIYNVALTPDQILAHYFAGSLCPAEPNTVCDSLAVDGPDGDIYGTYTATVNSTDGDDGALLTYSFSVDNGEGIVLTAGPQESNSATFDLTDGTWTFNASVDDEPLCPDAGGAVCSSVVKVVNTPIDQQPLYPRLVMAESSLIAYWRLGDLTATVASDETGNFDADYDPEIAAVQVDGALVDDINKSATFNGGIVSTREGDNSAFDAGTDPITVECWTRPAATRPGGEEVHVTQFLLSKEEGSNDFGFDYQLAIGAPFRDPNDGSVISVRFEFISQNPDPAFGNRADGPEIPPFDGETWYHVVGVQDPDFEDELGDSVGAIYLYVNGVLVASKTPLVQFGSVADHPLWIGTRVNPGTQNRKSHEVVWGEIDEVAIYREALSPETIRDHYLTGVGESVGLTGACCIPTGSCSELSEVECTTVGGVYQGNGTTCGEVNCPLPGACCQNDGGREFCSVTPASRCGSLGGDFKGDGTPCEACTTLLGACCLDGVCSEASEEDCLAMDGATYNGDRSTCDTVTCPPLTGACCLDGVCSEASEEDCLAMDGATYNGDRSTCGPESCPAVGETFRRGDCDQSGTVDFNDAIFHLKFLFLGENEDIVNGCKDACDSDDSGADDFTDDINTLKVLFLGQGEIPEPSPLPDETHPCGLDPTLEEPDELTCETYEPTIGCP